MFAGSCRFRQKPSAEGRTMQTEIKHEAERLADAAKTNLMIEGTIWKQLLLFSIPLILGNLLQQM